MAALNGTAQAEDRRLIVISWLCFVKIQAEALLPSVYKSVHNTNSGFNRL